MIDDHIDLVRTEQVNMYFCSDEIVRSGSIFVQNKPEHSHNYKMTRKLADSDRPKASSYGQLSMRVHKLICVLIGRTFHFVFLCVCFVPLCGAFNS